MRDAPASRARAWLVLLAIAAGALAFQLMQRSRTWTERSQAGELGRQLLAAESELQAAAIAEQLGELDEAGIAPLVAALTSESLAVSDAAAAEIAQELGEWRSLPKKTSAPLAAELIRELAQQHEAIPLEHQWQVRQWAQVILLWPLRNSTVDAGALLDDCQAILELPLPPEVPLEPRLAQAEEPPPTLSVEAPSDMPAEETLAPIVDPSSLVPPATPPPTAPEMPPEPDEDTIKAPILEPRGFLPPKARRIEDDVHPKEPQPLPEGESQPLPAEGGDDLRGLPDLEVMRELHSGAVAAQEAEGELARRGYKPPHLALAWRLTDPDPKVRRRLAEALPRITGVDPRPWLLRLSEDADDEVRTAARSILKTSSDPELQSRLR